MALSTGTWSHAATFSEQKASVSKAVEAQEESTIRSLLEAGLAENKPAQAAALASDWLRDNLPESPRLLFLLGRCSELSGNWKEAVAFYQQFLKQADATSEDAAEAITATYTLLIHQLDDIEGAYIFGQLEASRLAINLRFRQFDRWFLDIARQRTDLSAAADRLLAISRAGLSADLLKTLYQDDLLWLIDAIGKVRLDQKQDRFTREFVSTVETLADSITFDEELKLLLKWKVQAKAYNMARIDGQETKAPIDTAKALISRFPYYAAQVQTDWAGGSNSAHYRDDPKKYWPHRVEAKFQPIQEALAKLGRVQQSQLLQTWSDGYYQRGPEILSPEAARKLARNNPAMVNRRHGPSLKLGWRELTLEEARELAPVLEYNPSPEAALIRSIAAAGASKDADKLVDELLKKEAWRLGSRELNSQYADQLWHWAGKPGGNEKRNQLIQLSRAVADKIPNPKSLVSVPAPQRLKQFRELWREFKSPAIQTPDILNRIRQLLAITPEAMNDLITDPSDEAEWLAASMLNTQLYKGKQALNVESNVNIVGTDRVNPIIDQLSRRYRGIDELKKRKLYQPHPLEPAIDKALRKQVEQKSLAPWLVTAWLNVHFPDNRERNVQLAAELLQLPAWPSMPLDVHHGFRSIYPELALTPAQQKIAARTESAQACASLLTLKADAGAAAAAEAVNATTRELLQAPTRIEPVGLDELAAVGPEIWSDEAFVSAFATFVDQFRLTTPHRELGDRLLARARESGDPALLLRTGAWTWTNVQTWHRPLPTVMELTHSLTATQPEAASALARMGLYTIARHKRGHTWFKSDTDIPALKTIRGKTAMQLGLIEIPVAPNHPSYPAYLSQAEWMTDNIDSAWKLLDANWETFHSIHRELTFPYTMWALQRSIENRDSDRQQQLIQSLLTWATEPNSNLRPAERGAVQIAYGDIAMQRGQVREALDIFKRVQNNEADEGLMVRHEAALRRVRALRISKDFDGALQVLSELELERIPTIWTKIRYARAEVHFDMEEYDDAQDDIDSILNRSPNHPDARILLGKVQLKRQKLMEATEVELGSTSSQQSLVPGENLKVTLSDPTLAVSGAGTEIEVAVWTTTGDREQFFLRQFGDQKTKFRGEVATALGAPAPDDGTLQVIGNDEIFYAYSKRFLKKMNQMEEKRGGPITVASNALLMASSRKLLNEAEQRRADMAAVMEDIQKEKHGNAEAAARAELARQVTTSNDQDASQRHERYLSTVAKPGNPIHIRVIDPDRSRTAQVDQLTVSLSSSSGDSISRITLEETDTHTGWFEGSVETTNASARAIARNSEPGRNPNMVISPKPDYPAWRPIASKDQLPEFILDLNDRVDLGTLKLTAGEPGFALEKFLVQTATRHGDWTTIGGYPSQQALAPDPWQPAVTVVNDAGRNAHYGARPVSEYRELKEHLNYGWLQTPEMAVAKNVAGPSEAFPASIPTEVKWLRGGRWENPGVVYHFKAHFHETVPVVRHFKLKLGQYDPKQSGIATDPKQLSEKPQYLLLIDGRPVSEPGQSNLAGSLTLKPGVHSIEILATGWLSNIGFGRATSLLTRSDEEAPWESCSDHFFDPASFPTGSYDHRNHPGRVTASKDGKAFTVDFAENSSTRLIRFLFVEQEGPVPAINTITLSDAEGKPVLPLADDFAELNKNDTLEILTGDRITVRYQDDRFVTKEKERQERFLTVSFTDARIEFADTKPRWDGRKNKIMPYHEKLLRFEHGNPISLVISDADMDSTVNPDTVDVTLSSKAGGVATFTATETGDSTGTFELKITPVTGTPGSDREFQVAKGGTLNAGYFDKENNRPGVLTERISSIEHAAFTPPQFVIGHAEVTPWQPEPGTDYTTSLHHGFDPRYQQDNPGDRTSSERIRPRWQIHPKLLPADSPPEGGFQAVMGQPLFLELVAPQYAIGVASTVDVYVQTDTGRKAAAAASAAANAGRFDSSIPGTIKVTGKLNPLASELLNWFNSPTLSSYRNQMPWPSTGAAATDRFRVSIPLIAGTLPPYGVLSEQEIEEMTRQNAGRRSSAKEILARGHSLVVKAGERIHIGFEFTSPDGRKQWLTASARVTTHPTFDIMDEAYRSTMRSAYAGEFLHLRVVDLGADTSDEIDRLRVLMQAKSGSKHYVTLTESGTHTGIFRDNILLSYAKAPGAGAEDLDPNRDGFPVTYGDTVAARYTSPNGIARDTDHVTISKGADGAIMPFSKKYADEEIAMRTQFSLAEAYLEMAKRHRALGQTEQADREYASAKLLLSKAMDEFTEPDTRAHAEYLLGMLTMEEAIATEDDELRETRFRAALSRFMNVTGTYPLSLHASRAQYRIASIYEQLQEPEIAAQEYVKLAYKYPDSEFLASSMAKLGTHFLKKAAAYEQEAKALLAQAGDDKDAIYEAGVLQKIAGQEYLKTASIFSRLQQRFPGNKLAGPAGLRAGQAYMRAKRYRDAVNMFSLVIREESYDGAEVRAQAMYWTGMCHQETRLEMPAYSMFKRLTYDFPESKWAAYARAQLSQERMLKLESTLELERLEAGQ